jgi:SAM-dependent methyltransferase
MTERGEYLLGMEPAEIARLERQHAVWHDTTSKIWELAGFRPGHTIVDLGSGPGFASVDLARLVGSSGRVIAIDSSAEARDHCRKLAEVNQLSNLQVESGDAATFEPPAVDVDGAFARWLFSYLSDPEAAIRAVSGGLRSGAVLAVVDYWNYLSIQTEPRSPLFAKVYEAVYESIRARGGSFDTAGRLPAMMEAAGLNVTEVEVFARVGRPGSPLWAWLDEFQRLHFPSLVKEGFLGSDDLQAFWEWWAGLAASSSSLLFAPPVLGIVAVKA